MAASPGRETGTGQEGEQNSRKVSTKKKKKKKFEKINAVNLWDFFFKCVQGKASGGLRSFRVVEAAKWSVKVI